MSGDGMWRHSLLMLALAGIACARQTGAARDLSPAATLADVADSADTLQPVPAELTLLVDGCPNSGTRVTRYGDHKYVWRGAADETGGVGGGWDSQAAFREGIRDPWRRWNECRTLTVYFGCTRGLDSRLGLTGECSESVTATRGGDGTVTLSAVVPNVN